MTRGRVYVWREDAARLAGGTVSLHVVDLPRLDSQCDANPRLQGRYVEVHNAGEFYQADGDDERLKIVGYGNAQPDGEGNFLFNPGRGGGRMDKQLVASEGLRSRSIEASHFGEVNTYYHLDKIAAYLDELLGELGAPGLPRVRAVVNAHHGATRRNGLSDGVWNGRRWRPFQGGHYRLPSKRYDIEESTRISCAGEIHLGPGFKLLDHGALVEFTGRRYRHNASHNAGTLYHEYGHHVTRHTADFRANAFRSPNRQSNRKTALDEGTCDYWAATMLGTPHIWSWHRRHDGEQLHCRSLSSRKTMKDYDESQKSAAHANGTIWAAGLWDLRSRLAATTEDGVRRADLLVLMALLEIGRTLGDGSPSTVRGVCAAREGMTSGLEALLRADKLLYGGRSRRLILSTFQERGICLASGLDREVIHE